MSRQAPLPPPAAGALRVAFLDVGQGDATLVQSGDGAMLVDAGPPGGGVIARLGRLGVARLDVLVATHAQADHIGDADAVIRELPVGVLLDGRDGVREQHGATLARDAVRRRVQLVPAAAGQRFRLGHASVEVLWPPARMSLPAEAADPNERAVVMLVRAAGTSVLLAADAESQVLTRLDLGSVDLFKVSHHGSADPGLPALLARLRPQLAVIEVGEGNRYGHPAPQTLSALRNSRVPVRRTDQDGTVVVDAQPGAMHVQALS
jgi:competence protein ComEC